MAHLALDRYRPDALQAIALARCEGRSIGAALDRLARDRGWVRARLPAILGGGRKWLREEKYWELYEAGYLSTYRQGHDGHARARAKVSPERRKEIARMGGGGGTTTKGVQKWTGPSMKPNKTARTGSLRAS